MTDLRGLQDAYQRLIALTEVLEEQMTEQPSNRKDWRQDFGTRRHRLQTAISETGQMMRGILTARNDPAEMRAFEDCIARCRSALALHQARWPTVGLDPADPAYLASMKQVQQHFLDYCEQIKRMAAPTPPPPGSR